MSDFSVVIEMELGHVKRIIWDNGCFYCADDASLCYEYEIPEYDRNYGTIYSYNCLSKPDTCAGDPYKCDPKVYISFIGTDSKSHFMNSAGNRFILVYLFFSLKDISI